MFAGSACFSEGGPSINVKYLLPICVHVLGKCNILILLYDVSGGHAVVAQGFDSLCWCITRVVVNHTIL